MKLNPYDIECIKSAREILVKDIRENKTITLLALEAGINENKLKKGFKQIFGLPVHSYLIQERMEKAKCLLEETDKSVKEIAIAVGYKRLSSFTKSFKKVIKQSPQSWRKGKPTDNLHNDNLISITQERLTDI